MARQPLFLGSTKTVEHKYWCVLGSGAIDPSKLFQTAPKQTHCSAKAEPISYAGGASTKNVWGVQILLHRRCMREEWGYVRATTLRTPRPVKKEWEDVLQAVEQRHGDLDGPLPVSLFLTILLYFFKGNKLKQFSPCQICFDHDGKWWVVFLVFLSTFKNFHLIFSPCLIEEGKWESRLSSTWQRQDEPTITWS